MRYLYFLSKRKYIECYSFEELVEKIKNDFDIIGTSNSYYLFFESNIIHFR